jgi:sarcosine oxidase
MHGDGGLSSTTRTRHDTTRSTILSPVDRRDFLKLAGAGAGLLVAGGCAPDIPAEPLPGLVPSRRRTPRLGAASSDVVVIGAGAFGGWTAYELLRRGANVTLVDTYGPGNSRSTSGDETRGIRSSYGDRATGELWMLWARESIRRWKAWDEQWGREQKLNLFFTTGDLILRSSEAGFIASTREIWAKHNIPHEMLTVDEVRYRWPVINTEGIEVVLSEPDAGVARARRSCQAVASVFEMLGGKQVIARATGWETDGGRLTALNLSDGSTLSADQFVFACGPWLGKVFPDLLASRMRTPLGSVFYYGTPPGDYSYNFPNLPSYNFPGVTGWAALGPDNRGFRVRAGGGGTESDPDLSDRYIEPERLVRARDFITQRFPGLANAPLLETRACHYEQSVSRNFIIDRHPQMSNVMIAGGGSAEGFKFGPVVGEYVAQRVLGDRGDAEVADGFRIPEDEYSAPPVAAPGSTPGGAAPAAGGMARGTPAVR